MTKENEIEMQDINDDGSLKENESLDEKIYTFNHYSDRNDFSFVKVKDVKEKIQNAQRRLKELGAKKHKYPVKDFLNEQNKIFKEEFGEKFI